MAKSTITVGLCQHRLVAWLAQKRTGRTARGNPPGSASRNWWVLCRTRLDIFRPNGRWGTLSTATREPQPRAPTLSGGRLSAAATGGGADACSSSSEGAGAVQGAGAWSRSRARGCSRRVTELRWGAGNAEVCRLVASRSSVPAPARGLVPRTPAAERIEAIRVLHPAVTVAPESPWAWVQLGVVSLVRQDHGTVGEALPRALDLDPRNEEARYHLALLHVLVGALDDARGTFVELAAEQGDWTTEAAAMLGRLRPAALSGDPPRLGRAPPSAARAGRRVGRGGGGGRCGIGGGLRRGCPRRGRRG